MGLEQYNQAELIENYGLHVEELSKYTFTQIANVDLNAYTFPLTDFETDNLTKTLLAFNNVTRAKLDTLEVIKHWQDKYKIPFTQKLNDNVEGIYEQLRYVMEEIIEVDWDTLAYDIKGKKPDDPDVNEDEFQNRRDYLGVDNG